MLELGTWQPGARFATEREMEEEFEVSRAVIRPALDLLVGDGAIFRVKGSGAFVAAPRTKVEPTGLVKLWASGDRDPLDVRDQRPQEHARPDGVPVSRAWANREPSRPGDRGGRRWRADRPSRRLLLLDRPLVPWLLPTAEALASGTKPPRQANSTSLGRTVSVERTFFSGWGGVPGGCHSGQSGPDGALRPVRRTNGAKRERPLEFARLDLPRRHHSARLRAGMSRHGRAAPPHELGKGLAVGEREAIGQRVDVGVERQRQLRRLDRRR